MTPLLSRFGALGLPVVACAFVGASARPAVAQVYEAVGIRAQGMAGAFIAVADDATATWWNPAGLATGALFSAIVERRSAQDQGDGALGLAVALPSLGLSYYRVRVTELPNSSSTASTTAGRQDLRAPGTRLPTHVLSQFGATVGQSLGDHVVLGSTLKLVRADQTRGDLDIGAMGTFGSTRLAIVVKHVGAPDLTADGERVGFDRQVRAGAAYISAARGGLSMVAAVDADLTTTATAGGDVRHVAGGVELWMGRVVGVRGGLSRETIGERRQSVSVGASVSATAGFHVDVQVTRGEEELANGWGIGLRVTF